MCCHAPRGVQHSLASIIVPPRCPPQVARGECEPPIGVVPQGREDADDTDQPGTFSSYRACCCQPSTRSAVDMATLEWELAESGRRLAAVLPTTTCDPIAAAEKKTMETTRRPTKRPTATGSLTRTPPGPDRTLRRPGYVTEPHAAHLGSATFPAVALFLLFIGSAMRTPPATMTGSARAAAATAARPGSRRSSPGRASPTRPVSGVCPTYR